MSKVVILTDSSAYLPKDLREQYNIPTIPLTLNWDGEELRDGVDIEAAEFYQRLEKSESIPTTSQVSIREFDEIFTRLVGEGKQVLYLGISSGISGSYNAAIQVQKKFPGKVEVLDTHLVSMALSFQVLTAARAAAAGASLQECIDLANKAYNHIGVYFTVDTLKYLNKGGRINSAKRLVGTMLNIKPILKIRDGKIDLVDSVISQRKAIEKMIELVDADIAGRTPVRLSVFHAGIPRVAQELHDRLVKKYQPAEAILSQVSPVIGAHTGPGTISIAYMAGM